MESTKLFIAFIDIIDSTAISADSNLGATYTKLLRRFQMTLRNHYNRFRVLQYSIRGEEGLCFLRPALCTRDVFSVIQMMYEIKATVESEIKPFRVGIGIHFGEVDVFYKDKPNVIESIEGAEINRAKRVETESRKGEYSKIFLSYDARMRISDPDYKKFFKRKDITDVKGYEAEPFICYELYNPKSREKIRYDDSSKGVSQAIDLEKELSALQAKCYSIIRDYETGFMDGKDPSSENYTLCIISLFKDMGFKTFRSRSAATNDTIVLANQGRKIHLEICNRPIGLAELSQRSKIIGGLNRKFIVFIGEDSKVEDYAYSKHISELRSKNVFLLLLNTSTLITLHHLHHIADNQNKERITNFFLSGRHLINSRHVREYQSDLMKSLVDDRIDDLEGISSEEERLRMLIAQILKTRKIHSPEYDRSSMRDVATIVEKIEALVYQIFKKLQRGNGSEKIDDVFSACLRLGIEEVRKLLDTIKFSSLVPSSFAAYGTTKDSFWEHSVLCGIFCDELAKKSGISIRLDEQGSLWDDFYVIGFLHDFGMVILDQIFKGFYRYSVIGNTKHFMVYQNEKKLHHNHATIGAQAFQQANFSNEFVMAIEHHHEPKLADLKIRPICCLLYIAEGFFSSLLIDDDSVSFGAGGRDENLDWCFDQLNIDVLEVQEYVEISETLFRQQRY
jgi:class 3 adenylate cyclase